MRKKNLMKPEECWRSICNNERMNGVWVGFFLGGGGQTQTMTMLDASNSPIKSLKLLQHVSGHTGINFCYLHFFFFFFLFGVHLYHNIFQKSTTYNKLKVSPLVM